MASGRPDWFGTIVAAGKYDSTFIPIALDEDGFITATMKGAYDSALKTIAVGSSGVMKANLSAQDLDFLTVRPAYGEAVRLLGNASISLGNTETLVTVNGRGVILGGNIYWTQTAHNDDAVWGLIYCEEALACWEAPKTLLRFNKYRGGDDMMFIGRMEPSTYKYAIGLSPGTTFETKLEIKAQNAAHATLSVYCALRYALVPS